MMFTYLQQVGKVFKTIDCTFCRYRYLRAIPNAEMITPQKYWIYMTPIMPCCPPLFPLRHWSNARIPVLHRKKTFIHTCFVKFLSHFQIFLNIGYVSRIANGVNTSFYNSNFSIYHLTYAGILLCAQIETMLALRRRAALMSVCLNADFHPNNLTLLDPTDNILLRIYSENHIVFEVPSKIRTISYYSRSPQPGCYKDKCKKS